MTRMSLSQCYGGIREVFASETLDSFEVVKEVARYRDIWKPEKVKVVLLAESHVHTEPSDFALRWSYKADRLYEGNYVRFVYCLANGERRLANIPSNGGTWQYWKLFYSCLNPISDDSDPPILRRCTPNFDQRMGEKIALLSNLREAGIWLVDASIVGIAGEEMATKAIILRHCWKTYTGQKLRNLDPQPKHIIIIGAGVEKTLKSEIDKLAVDHSLVVQPNARLSGGYSEYYWRCFEICSKFRN